MRRRNNNGIKLILMALILSFIGYEFLTLDLFKSETPIKNNNFTNQLTKQQDKLVDEQKEVIEDLTIELIEYKQQEKEEELRKQRIKALQNPDIIYNELENNNNLKLKTTVRRGVADYKDIIYKKSIFNPTELDIIRLYNYEYAIEIEANQVQVIDFIEDTVIVQIPKLKSELIRFEEFTEEEYEKAYNEKKYGMNKPDNTNEQLRFLSKKFTAKETKTIDMQAKQKAREGLILDNESKKYDDYMNQFKDDLKNFIARLGYSRVVIEEY